MRRLLLFLVAIWSSTVIAQDTVVTSPPLTSNNGQSGVTFALETNQPIEILELLNVFDGSASSANLWMRQGGVSASGSPTINAANGWVQVITNGTVTGANGSTVVPLSFGSTTISIPANSRMGFFVDGNTDYQTGTSADQVIYTDGTVTIDVSDSIAYGGGPPSPGFNPRRFLGGVIYKLGIVGNCTPFTNFSIDSIGPDSAVVNWTPGSGNNSFDLEYGVTGFTPGSGTLITGNYPGAAQPPATLTGLTANTAYDVYLYEFCNSGADTAYFPSPQGFTTTKLCAPPSNFSATNITSFSADLSWNHGGTPQEFWVLYGPDGFTPSSTSNQDTVAGTTTSYTLNGLNPSFDYDMYVVANCGGTNGVSDTIGPIDVETPIAGPRGVNCITGQPGAVLYDGFESQGGWTGDIGTSSGQWQYNSGSTGSGSTGPSGAHAGSQYLYVETSGIGPYTATIVSPAIDLTTANDSAELSFWIHAYGATMGTLDVGVSTSPTGTFTPVFTQNGQLQTSESDPYQNVGVRLDAYVGQTIYLQFDYTSGSSFTGDIAIDELQVTSCQTCPFPSQLAVDSLSSDGALVSWNGSASNYDVNWGPAGFAQGSPASSFDSSSTNSFFIDSLSGNTAYDVYIRTNCTDSGDGFSGWIGPLTLVTECNPFTAAYFTNFDNDSVGEAPTCWDNYLVGSFVTAEVESPSFGTQPYSAPNHLVLANRFGNDTVIAISPNFSDMPAGDKQVRFYVAAGSSFNGSDLLVGTMADPRDVSTITMIDTVIVQGNDNYFEVSVTLDSVNGYNGSDHYIVLAHDIGSSFDDILIDDFNYEDQPSCLGPNSNATGVSSVTANTADIFWSGGQGDTTKVLWGLPGFNVPGGALGTGYASGTDTSFTITGLAPQTTYEFYLQDSCAAAGSGLFIGPFSLTTACLPLTAPVTEDFDDTNVWTSSSIDQCWGRSNFTSFGHQWEVNSGSTGSSNTGPSGDNTSGSGQYLYTETSSSSPNVTTLFTPLIDASNLTVPFLEFFYHRYGSDMGTLKVDINDGSGWSNLATYTGPDQTSSGDPWTEVGIDVSAYGDTVQFRFESTRGSSFRGDGAIDDFSVIEAPSCPKPANLNASGVLVNEALLNWNTVGSANGYQVWFGPLGFYQGTQTTGGVQTMVSGNATDSLLLDTISSNTCYEFLVRAACGPGDSSEWVGPVTFCTECSAFNTRYLETFDVWPPSCWKVTLGTQDWVNYQGTGGDNYAEAPLGSSRGDSFVMSSPFINVGTVPHRVQFDWSHRGSSFGDDTLIVYVKGVNSGLKDTLLTLTGAAFDDPGASFNSPGNFINEKISLPTAFNGQLIQVFFKGISDFGDPLYINDASVEKIPSCFEPDSIGATNVTQNSADLNWVADSQSTGNNFQISYGVAPSAPGQGTRQVVTGLNTTVTGLQPASLYQAYVREICAPGDTSFWHGPVGFTTLCVPYTLPFSENFDGQSWIADDSDFSAENSEIGLCWSRDPNNGSDYGWRVRSTSTGSGATGPNSDATGGNFVYTEASDGRSGDTSALISPQIDLGTVANPRMTYGYHFYGNDIDRMFIEVFDGTSWNLESTRIGATQSSSGAAFLYDTVDLSSYSGLVQIRFRSVSAGCCSGDMALDSIVVTGDISCPKPTNVATAQVGCDSVEVTWNANSSGSFIQYGPAGFTPGQGNFTGIVTSPHTITGLNPGTAYDFWVADTCGGDTSSFAGPVTDTTATGPLPTAAISIDSAIVGGVYFVYLDASGSMNADSYQWNYGNGSSGSGVLDTNGYSSNSPYTITLVASNGCGSDTATFTTNVNIGLADNPLQQSLNIYPNPTQGVLNIEVDQVDSEVTLRLTDMQGKVMLQQRHEVPAHRYDGRLDIGDLASGMYMLEIESDGQKARQRVNLR